MNSSIILIVVWIVIAALLARAKKKGAAKQSSRSSAAAAAQPVPVRSYRRPSRADNCDFGDANHYYSHQYDRRIQQLEGYLKAGLIDQKEYREMLVRYKKQMNSLD